MFTDYFLGNSEDKDGFNTSGISEVSSDTKATRKGSSSKKKMLFGVASIREESGMNDYSHLTSDDNMKDNSKFTKDNTTVESDDTNIATSNQQKELIFINFFRVGDININISLNGFGKIEVTKVGLAVPEFQMSYKVGDSKYLIMKFCKHLLKNLALCGVEKIRDKLSRKKGHTLSSLNPFYNSRKNDFQDSIVRSSCNDISDSSHTSLLFGKQQQVKEKRIKKKKQNN